LLSVATTRQPSISFIRAALNNFQKGNKAKTQSQRATILTEQRRRK
jgi:hypothetical protein